jgi:ammonium transporter, Amt family
MTTSLLGRAWTRFHANLRDPYARRYVALLMGGKLLGFAFVLGVVSWSLPAVAHAAGVPAGPITEQINAVNTVWTLIAAFLVFCMQVGFVMLEAGFARSRESVNILVEGIADTCICGILFWA